MSIEVKMNMKAITEALMQNAKATRVSASDVLRLEMGSIARSMQTYTPPHVKGASSETGDKELGWKRVEKDIRKILKETVASKEEWITLKNLGTQAYKFTSANGAVYAIDEDHYWPSPSNSKLQEHHNKHRRKDGRVTEARGGSERGRNSMDIGRWKGVAWVHTKPSVVQRYIKFKQKSVGKLKAGWNAAIKEFQGKRPAAWVARHKDSPGYGQDRLKKETFTGWLGAINAVRWAGLINQRQIIPFVLKMHQTMIDTKLKNVVGNAVRRFNAINKSPQEIVKVA
jgi:hypothetical protein